MEFNEIVGKSYPFYGIDNQCFKLGQSVWEVVEDPSDGYRSYLETVSSHDASGLIFSGFAFANVRVVGSFGDGYELIDTYDKHIWLEFGTNYDDDYYPRFYFRYTPKVRKDTPMQYEYTFYVEDDETTRDLLVALGSMRAQLYSESEALQSAYQTLQDDTPLKGSGHDSVMRAILHEIEHLKKRTEHLESVEELINMQRREKGYAGR